MVLKRCMVPQHNSRQISRITSEERSSIVVVQDSARDSESSLKLGGELLRRQSRQARSFWCGKKDWALVISEDDDDDDDETDSTPFSKATCTAASSPRDGGKGIVTCARKGD